jgi:hypothetical protein
MRANSDLVFRGAHAPSRAIASPARTFGAAPKRTWHSVAVPGCMERKVRDDEGVIASTRGRVRSPDETESVAGEIEAHEVLQTPFFAKSNRLESAKSWTKRSRQAQVESLGLEQFPLEGIFKGTR